jgi:hypothetical protein
LLAERTRVYQQLKEDSEALKAHKYKTEKENKQEFEFMRDVDSKALQSTTPASIRRLSELF